MIADGRTMPVTPSTLLLVASAARSLVWQFSPIIEAALAARHRVIALVPRLGRPDNLMLAALGVELVAPDQRSSMLRAWANTDTLTDVLDSVRPDIVLGVASGFTRAVMKVVQRRGGTHTVLAAHADDICGRPGTTGRFNAMIDLRALRWRPVLPGLSALLVPTGEDRRRLISSKGWPAEVHVVASALPGVDCDGAYNLTLPPAAVDPLLLLAPDPDDTKAVARLVAAAQRARRLVPNLTFGLVGTVAPPQISDGILALLDDRATDAALMRAVGVAVPMTRHRVPPLTFEALRRGRALIVPDTPLGYAIVDEPLNGIIVPCGTEHSDISAWADAMVKAARFGDLALAMARASAQKAERGFDRARVMADAAQAFPAGFFDRAGPGSRATVA